MKRAQTPHRLMRPKPYHKIIGNLRELIHHRNWLNMNEEQRINDIRTQFILAEGRICCYPNRADVLDELLDLVDYLASPIYYAKELDREYCNYLKANMYAWVKQLPHTRDMAIRSLERFIARCDRHLAKLQRDQKNEFLYTMGIRIHDYNAEIEKGAQLLQQLFGEEVKELEAEKAANNFIFR